MKDFMGAPYNSIPAQIICESDNEKDACIKLIANLLSSDHPVNLLPGSDLDTINILEAMLTSDGKTERNREFFINCEGACCQQCARTGNYGQGRQSLWSMARWFLEEHFDGDWHSPGGEILCPEDHDSEFKKVASQLGPDLMKHIRHITITTGSRHYIDLPTFCSALQNIRRYIPNPSSITIIYGDGLHHDSHPCPDTETLGSSVTRSIWGSVFTVSTLGQGALQAPNSIPQLPALTPTIHEQRRRRKESRGKAKEFVKQTLTHKKRSNGNLNIDGAAETPHHRGRRDVNISTHDFAVVTDEKEKQPKEKRWTINNFFGWITLCLLLIVNWPILEWSKFLNRRRDRRIEWKVKLMVWRLEDCLEPGERIKHVGDGFLGDSLWQTGGRRYWQ